MEQPRTLAPDADPYQVQLKLEQTLLAGDVSKQTHDTIRERIVSSGNCGGEPEPESSAERERYCGIAAGLAGVSEEVSGS